MKTGLSKKQKAPLADFKGQTAVSVIVDQSALGGIFSRKLGEPLFECGIVGADLDHAVCFVKIDVCCFLFLGKTCSHKTSWFSRIFLSSSPVKAG